MAFGQNAVEIIISARDQFSKVFNRAKLSMQSFQKSALAAAAVGAGIAVAFGKAIQTSIDFESAFTGVRKTVDLTEEGFAELEQRFKTLSTETGTTFVELSKIGELAGQLGVSGVDNIDKFTRVIADLSVTTNLTAEAAATDFARFANIMNMPIENVDRLGAVVVDLGNNMATTEAEIVAMGMRIAGAGKALKFSEGEVMAWSAALSSVGVEAQMGGTAISKMMINISSMVANGSGDLKKFADVAGMTTDEFSKAFEEDASGALQLFFKGLNKVGDEGGNILQVLEKLDIKEVRLRDTVLRLASGYDKLDTSLGIQGGAWEENTALTDEAGKRYATMEREIAKVKAQFAILGDEIGDRLVPFIRDYLLPAIKKVIDWWTNLSPWMKDAILIFAGVTMAVTLLAGAIALVTLVASPWLLIIGAIILAITGLILLIKNWGEITSWLGEKLKPVFDFLKKWFAPEIALLKVAIKALGMMFSWIWDNKIKPFWDKFKGLLSWLEEHVLPILKIIVEGVGGAIGKVADFKSKVGAGIEKVTNVGDAIIRPNGEIIKTHPQDTLIATRNGIGGGITLIIEGNVYGTDPDEIAEALNDKLKDGILI